MNFLLTNYIYPIRSPLILSESLGICLDNPRSEEEISYVENYLKFSHENSPEPSFPPNSEEELISLEWVLKKFEENCIKQDEYAIELLRQIKDENIYRKHSKLWIIARYDDQGEYQRLKEIRTTMEEDERGLIILDEDHPIEIQKSNTINYFSLLSLLCHSQPNDYYGRQILIDNEFSDMERHIPNRHLWHHHYLIFMIHSTADDWEEREDSMNWIFFPKAKEKILETTSLLEQTIKKENPENMLYLGSVLKTVAESNTEDKVRILFLTSILEFLLTHNPDYNRFNIEDSINKQFQLKASILIYLNNKSINLDTVKNKLKLIYSVRSNIAHGNFKEISKILKRKSKLEGEEAYLSDIVTELYDFVRAALEERLKDRLFVKFLKEG